MKQWKIKILFLIFYVCRENNEMIVEFFVSVPYIKDAQQIAQAFVFLIFFTNYYHFGKIKVLENSDMIVRISMNSVDFL